MDIGQRFKPMSFGSSAITNMGFKLKAKFAHLFTNLTKTVNGTRYLVNQGRDGVDAVMHTGQGVYFNGVDNYIETNHNRNFSDFTILLTADYSLQNNRMPTFGFYSGAGSAVSSARQRSQYIGRASNNLSEILIGDPSINNGYAPQPFLLDGVASLAVSYRFDTEVYDVYKNGVYITSGKGSIGSDYETYQFIGGRNQTNGGTSPIYSNGSVMGVYRIPKALTAQEIAQHYNNPEQTLYWDNGVLKSDILDQATIDSMQAGNGFWYPLTENVSAGGYYRNHALPMPGNLVVNGGFATNDLSEWVISGNGNPVYSIVDGVLVVTNTVSGYSTASITKPADIGVPYLIRCKAIRMGSKVNVTATGVNLGNLDNTEELTLLVVPTTNEVFITFKTAFGGAGLDIGIDNVSIEKAESYTPLTNWTATTSTNAKQLTTGYQCALQELDSFGLPINPATIDVQADTLADAQAQLTNKNGLTLTDNAGTLELYK